MLGKTKVTVSFRIRPQDRSTLLVLGNGSLSKGIQYLLHDVDAKALRVIRIRDLKAQLEKLESIKD